MKQKSIKQKHGKKDEIIQPNKKEKREEKKLDEAIKMTFPASDAVSIVQPKQRSTKTQR